MVTKGSFHASDQSLDMAASIADRLGMPFDREGVRQGAATQLRDYYSDIASVLPDETRNCHFESFAFRDFSAFAEPLNTGALVSIDEQWSLFLFTANILLCVRACKLLGPEERVVNAGLFRENLLVLSNPFHHETVREQMRPVFHAHADVLPLANLLTKAMYGFMICHEIAHIRLGHTALDVAARDHELTADRVGLGYLLRVCQHFESLASFKVAPNIIGAPVIGMRHLRSLEMLGLIDAGSETHPDATTRMESLRDAFNQVACEEARYLLDGLEATSDELLEEIRE